MAKPRNNVAYCVADPQIRLLKEEIYGTFIDKDGKKKRRLSALSRRQIENHNEVYKKLCLQK